MQRGSCSGQLEGIRKATPLQCQYNCLSFLEQTFSQNACKKASKHYIYLFENGMKKIHLVWYAALTPGTDHANGLVYDKAAEQ